MSKFYSIDDMIGCAKRELLMRQRVYPRRVELGSMRAEKAEWETECMAAILDKLISLSGRRNELRPLEND